MALHTLAPDLSDLAEGSPLLPDPSGQSHGVRLREWLGAGGMAAVFRAEREVGVRGPALTDEAPERLAIKIALPRFAREVEALNFSAESVFLREKSALERLMSTRPPSEFVVGYHGSGRCALTDPAGPIVLPWLALEHVTTDGLGPTLRKRVESARGGLEPARALRLVRGLLEGTRTLHAAGILHRDLKPDNVLVAGTVEDEIPKLADYGIARVADAGFIVTIPGGTEAYAALEQSRNVCPPGVSNPLVGEWTDVHGLTATIWFLLAGEDACRGRRDKQWEAGVRRSLSTAGRLHEGLTADAELFDELDAVLARGLSPRLPPVARERSAARAMLERPASRHLALPTGPERYASVAELEGPLLRTLEAICRSWERRCAVERLPTTLPRAGEMPPSRREPAGRTYAAEELPACWQQGRPEGLIPPGRASFRSDGRALVLLGDGVFFLGGRFPQAIPVPPHLEQTVRETHTIVRSPHYGFDLVGPGAIVRLGRGQLVPVPLPARTSGGAVGPIEHAARLAGGLAIVTAETDEERGGPELWHSPDGTSWSEPRLLPFRGDVRSLARGPYGWLAVGGWKGRGRALFLPERGPAQVLVDGVHNGPPLLRAVVTAEDQWLAAGAGFVLALHDGLARTEPLELTSTDEVPVAMEADGRGEVWLVTTRAVHRRSALPLGMGWRTVLRRAASRPPFVAFALLAEGPRLLDAEGSMVNLRGSPLQPG